MIFEYRIREVKLRKIACSNLILQRVKRLQCAPAACLSVEAELLRHGAGPGEHKHQYDNNSFHRFYLANTP